MIDCSCLLNMEQEYPREYASECPGEYNMVGKVLKVRNLLKWLDG